MTDLSAIFSSKAFSPAQPPHRIALQPNLNSPFTTNVRNPNAYKSEPYSHSARARSIDRDIPISNQAKKIITFDNLQQQATWFEKQNFIQCAIKILIAVAAFVLFYYVDKLSWNTLLCWIVFSFLLLGLQHNIFGAGMFNVWVNCSLVGTTLVLANQIFLSVISKISSKSASVLFYTYESLIPSAYVTVLIMIMFYSLPLLSQPTPRSVFHNILSYAPSLLQLFGLIFKLKVAIFQAYSLMLIMTSVTSALYVWQDDGDREDYQNLFANILNPFTLLAQLITFFWILIIMHFILRVISSSVSKIAIDILYNEKNRDTKLPMILQLLKITPSDRLLTTQQQWNKFSLMPLVKLMKLDFSPYKKQRVFSRSELQNLYRHSLMWVKDMLIVNPNALNTRISTSKFYHNYFDIFKEFSEAQLNRCAGCLFQLSRQIQNLSIMRSRPKDFSQDLFFWAKIVKKQFQIWGKAVQCCKYLKIADQIIQILSLAEIDPELWAQSQIGRNLSQIKDRSEQLKQNNKLNPVIRQKLQEYYNKTQRILQE